MAIAPTLLVAAMAVQIAATLELDSGVLGLAVSSFFGATAATTALLSRLVSRYGPRAGLTAVMVVNTAVLLALAASQATWMIVTALVIGGIANGAVHPASNAVLTDAVRGHLGLALGIKQSSMPAAALIGGLAVPAIALTVGWRWAFVLAAVVSCSLVVACIRYRSRPLESLEPAAPAEAVSRPAAHLRLKLLSVGVCCGAAAGTSLTVFLVDGSVQSQVLTPSSAGLLAAACGSLAVLVRIGLGWLADRRPHANPTHGSFGLLVLCVAGAVLMTTTHGVAFVVGALLAAGAGFGWTGLVHLAALRGHAVDTARTTGTLMTGFASGSCLGPLVLGQLADHLGYRPMWLCATILAFASAVLLAMVARGRRPDSAPPPHTVTADRREQTHEPVRPDHRA